jgi:uncharacterized protein (TIGR02271 family)
MNSNITETIIGVFKDETTARNVVEQLVENGFSRQNVHLSSESPDTAASYQTSRDAKSSETHHEHGFMGWLHSLFGENEDEDTRRYSGAVGRGQYIVAVDSDENLRDRAVQIMNNNNAVDVDVDSDQQTSYPPTGAGFSGTGRDYASTGTATPYSGTDTANAPRSSGEYSRGTDQIRDTQRTEVNAGETIPVVQEELKVGKRVVQRGGVRVYSRVIDEPVEETVRLREENVRVDRRPANRPVDARDEGLIRDQTIEVTETAEEPVFTKSARVVEEVVVGKDVNERTETIRDTVRRTQVDVEPIAGQNARSATTDVDRADYDSDFRRDYETRYSSSGEPYENYAPAYQFGSRYASNPDYRGKSFEDSEERLKTEYLRNNPNSAWDRAKGAVRYGWEKVTGKR